MGSSLTDAEKSYLLSLARKSIQHYFQTRTIYSPVQSEIPSPRMLEQGACFVTLHLRGQLRGCIGSLEAHRPLINDVIENALASAFEDFRFYPLSPAEFKQVKISISHLSFPEPMPVKDSRDLLSKLIPNKHGLILQRGSSRATFLPAVWEELPTSEEFLSHLCMKAGIPSDSWRETSKMKFYTYEADEFEEK